MMEERSIRMDEKIFDPWALYLRLKNAPMEKENDVWRYSKVDPGLVLDLLVYLDYKASENNG